MSDEWKPEHFSTVAYEYDDAKLDNPKTRVRLVVQVDGKTEVDLTSRHTEFEPGVVAFVSRPDKRGIQVVKVLPAPNGHITDAGPTEPAPPWAVELLGLKE